MKLPLPELRDLGDNGLARTPPMGWNSWNKFAAVIDDKTCARWPTPWSSSGMRDAGYIYVNIDDTWEGEPRRARATCTTNEKFPDMKALADYVHSQGPEARHLLRRPGRKTCAGYGAATATRSRTPRRTPPGASTT